MCRGLVWVAGDQSRAEKSPCEDIAQKQRLML
nr:MAG TPA: hypothetical protein [Caudoviricetes sp.]